MLSRTARTFNELYPLLLQDILDGGRPVSPREQGTREICGYSFHLDSIDDSVPLQAARKLNYRWAVFEGLANILGEYPKALVLKFNKNMAAFMNQETGTWDGAYPPRIRIALEHIKRLLQHDSSSRRAVVPIYGHDDLKGSLDIACTISLQFLIRDDHLNLVAVMRSNDALLGTAYDVNQFTMLQRALASDLGIEAGWYEHFAGSMHLYDRDHEKATAIIWSPGAEEKQFKHPDWSGVTLNFAQSKISDMFKLLTLEDPPEMNYPQPFKYYYDILTKIIKI